MKSFFLLVSKNKQVSLEAPVSDTGMDNVLSYMTQSRMGFISDHFTLVQIRFLTSERNKSCSVKQLGIKI